MKETKGKYKLNSKRSDNKIATHTGEDNLSIAQQHDAMLDKIMTPPDPGANTVQGLRDTDDGPYWGKELPTPALGSGRINQ